MSIYDVIKNDIQNLKGLKLSVADVDTWQTVMQVVMDLEACVNAIEANTKAQAEAATETPAEPEPSEVIEAD